MAQETLRCRGKATPRSASHFTAAVASAWSVARALRHQFQCLDRGIEMMSVPVAPVLWMIGVLEILPRKRRRLALRRTSKFSSGQSDTFCRDDGTRRQRIRRLRLLPKARRKVLAGSRFCRDLETRLAPARLDQRLLRGSPRCQWEPTGFSLRLDSPIAGQSLRSRGF